MQDRPDPIRTDGSNDFAYHTMTDRTPNLMRGIQRTNPDYPSHIIRELDGLRQALIDNEEIQPLDLHPAPTPDYDMWLEDYKKREGDHWLDSEWYYAYAMLHRHILQVTRWFETYRDPYAPQKEAELDTDNLWNHLEKALTLNVDKDELLNQLIAYDLWSNRMDLSHGIAEQWLDDIDDDDLVIDNRSMAINHIMRTDGVVHFICDNAGMELAMDLVLADALLNHFSDQVVLHIKHYPIYVSDTIVQDVRQFMTKLQEGNRPKPIQQFGERVQADFDAGRIRLAPHSFWNSSRFMWEMPDSLHDCFEDAQIIFMKGDANYRAAVGDAVWDTTTPFEDVVDYFPAPVLALRTMKSDPIIGLKPGQAEALTDRSDKENWRTSGEFGVIQYNDGKRKRQEQSD
jgi:uncharacterized protein with ATP-grasp and redox domains